VLSPPVTATSLLFNRCIHIHAFGLKFSGNLRRELIGLGQQGTDLPHLSFRKRFLKSWHTGKSDPVLYLPEGFADRIIRDHVFLVEQLWRGKMSLAASVLG
jgi:hypothetical protein